MNGLLMFLIFAGLFYVMMRFGCGAHMVHGHGDHGSHSEDGVKYIDPVCGMEVGKGEGYAKAHEGTVYRFCSRSCLDKFDTDPGRYFNNPPERSDDREGML